ncbi:MAG TPA: hypothetical protein VMZ22_08985 [Acidimicrobiales bacterium]|nr:hypothetical protein [Acidimicrobiales bacterium]
MATPNPSVATTSSLRDVACSSATACTAVGYYVNGSGEFFSLVERWNGSSWALQATPVHAGATETQLEGVSCPSSSACTAVGYYKNGFGIYLTLAQRWNGTSWIVQPTPNPSGATQNRLRDVSCSSVTACTAVGNYVKGSAQSTLAERWNGTGWVRQATPNPAGSTWSVLYGVSCVAPRLCTAPGSSSTSAIIRPLAERYE